MVELGGRCAEVALPLTTERLTLRLPVPKDASALSRAGNDRRVSRGTFVPYPFTVEKARAFVERNVERAKSGEGLWLVIEERSSGRVLGTAGLAFRPRDPITEVFYWLDPDVWGRGFATEAVSALLAQAFGKLRCHRVTARIMDFNVRSRRVLERAGFRPEGRLREVRKEGGTWQDEIPFGLLESEYRRRGRSGRRPAERPPRGRKAR